MNYQNVRSSNIDSIGYDNKKSILGIRFKHGAEYHYFDVPKRVFEDLLNASSIGRYFDRHIKKAGYRCVKVKP